MYWQAEEGTIDSSLAAINKRRGMAIQLAGFQWRWFWQAEVRDQLAGFQRRLKSGEEWRCISRRE